jgi:hypothetical protein
MLNYWDKITRGLYLAVEADDLIYHHQYTLCYFISIFGIARQPTSKRLI